MTMLGLQRLLVAMLCVMVGLIVFATFQALGNQGACMVDAADGARPTLVATGSPHLPVRPR